MSALLCTRTEGLKLSLPYRTQILSVTLESGELEVWYHSPPHEKHKAEYTFFVVGYNEPVRGSFVNTVIERGDGERLKHVFYKTDI